MQFRKSFASLMMIGLLAMSLPACAEETLMVGASQSKVVRADGVSKVAVADPSIADVMVLSNDEILVVGKKSGSTSLHMWKWGTRYSYTIVVDNANPGSANVIKQVIGYPNVDVTVAGDKVILEGTVNGQYEMNRAVRVAEAYGGSVVNLLEMAEPKQVLVEARVIDINKEKSKDIGMQWGNPDSSDTSGSSAIRDGGSSIFNLGQAYHNGGHGGKPFHWFGSYDLINAQLTAMVAHGDAKILSQPYIITLSGEKAKVHIGGQLAVPVAEDDGTNSVEWKDYGIMLDIEPRVTQNNSIDTKINTEVSSIANTSVKANGLDYPSILTRSANTHVYMKPGMTMAIGGLISSEESKNITKIPLLGDIPILGHFFRNTSKRRVNREIIILLTPMVVDSDYMPVMSSEANRLSRLKDEEVLRGELYNDPTKKKQ